MSKVPTPLSSDKVPEKFRHLIPLAEKWCETEDPRLIDMLKAASEEEIEVLRSDVVPIAQELYIWLWPQIYLITIRKIAHETHEVRQIPLQIIFHLQNKTSRLIMPSRVLFISVPCQRNPSVRT